MVEKSSEGYQVQFISHTQAGGGFIEYHVKITAPGNFVFHIRDRYSSMRAFQAQVKNGFSLSIFEGLPAFPKKKAFGSKNAEFLNSRSGGLQHFFNSFFQNKEILRQADHLLQIYFQSHAADETSRQKLKEYMDYKENKNQQLKEKPKVLTPTQAIDTSKPVNMVVGNAEPRSVPELLSTQASGQTSKLLIGDGL